MLPAVEWWSLNYWTSRKVPCDILNNVHSTIIVQSCPTLCSPVGCSPPGSSAHGILQARILEWVIISFCRGSSRPRDGTHISYVSYIGGRVLYQLSYQGSPHHLMAYSNIWVILTIHGACIHAKSLQSCLTFCDPMDCSPARLFCP